MAPPFFRRDISHEGARTVPSFDEALRFEFTVSLNHRGGVDPELTSELAHRLKALASAQLTGGDGQLEPRGDLGVQRSRASRIDLIEQGKGLRDCIVVMIQ